ncbi:hypothetical protein QP794_03855 [Paenibacillus sp. UMB7766-LJ446]|uniref:hypothetical protein n=1 Tax=Paenibacillus sp. UMB7766-LJ446 TaxID=3046313 RepID=UPI00254BA862|nr:hypothetical protein [Paenibacillus sp. UMB7766-LJ446]MDK8189215.1 hypothetical protein [Paenibacillus sp. UMB7766-LJ446]
MNFQFSDEEKSKINKDAERQWINYQKADHKCYKKDCKEISIGSHAISESISLAKISVNGEMNYFESKRNGFESKSLFIKPIGKGVASTFQGFCEKHDTSIFIDIDNSPHKYSVKQILLQCYRSVCYADYHNNYYTKVFDDSSFDFVRNFVFNSSESEFFKGNVKVLEKKEEILEDIIRKTIDSINYEHRIFYDLKTKMEFLLEWIEEKKFEDPFNHTLKQRCNLLGFSFFYRKVAVKIPVAVVNQHILRINGNKTYLLFTVVPYADSTEIYWIFEDAYYETLSKKWDEMNATEINLLNRIESSMIQFEHWFIDPRIINSIPTNRLNIIKEDIVYNHDKNVFVDYDLSIFDDLRLDFIKYVDESTRLIERQKIDNNVQRNPKNERERLYKEYVLNQILNIRIDCR